MSLPIVPSFLRDAWWQPDDDAAAVLVSDASTGEPLARVSAAGADLEAAMMHGRTVGQTGLGALTFHQRALLLKELALALTARKEELYLLSASTGATKRDSLVDVDGGIGVLFSYGSRGRRELPNARVLLDGAPEPLSVDGSFLGQHIWTSLPGVAVQINAFNFPVWGMLEKFAPAFLAGVPTVAKPASATAMLTEATVRVMVESGLLPDGALQLIVGSARELLDLTRFGDLVGFTGSAETAAQMRTHPAVIRGGVRFTSEADSLNAAILGPDATEGTPEFVAFTRAVFQEMVSKAGQKCTSIRRVIVPNEMLRPVAEAVDAMLKEKVVIGDPRAEGVTMGPLAGAEQLAEVRARLAEFVEAGGVVVAGTLDAPTPREVPGGAGFAEGAFVAPVLFQFADAWAEVPHDREVFGPVAALLGYTDLAEAVLLARRGQGSLVATIASYDPEVVAELTLGIASAHGRVHLLDRDDAKSSTGHGSPVPHLVHGGPGRAGGGEELGGIRAVRHHLQRTALQGSPAMLSRVTGVWVEGAPIREEAGHPFRHSLATLRVGDRVVSEEREVTLADIESFAEMTGDTFYAHMDEAAAAANPFFPGRVAHGYLLISWAAGLFVDPAPGPVLANTGLEQLRFVTPVSPGDRIRVRLTARKITPRETEDYGEVNWDAQITNQNDELVASYQLLTLVAKTPDAKSFR